MFLEDYGFIFAKLSAFLFFFVCVNCKIMFVNMSSSVSLNTYRTPTDILENFANKSFRNFNLLCIFYSMFNKIFIHNRNLH